MEIGKVVGKVWLSSAHPTLKGYKLLIVKGYDPKTQKTTSSYLVAVDSVQAGTGDIVFYCGGSAVNKVPGNERMTGDKMISGIIDAIELDSENT